MPSGPARHSPLRPDLASAAEEDRDRKAAEVATLTRALTDLRDRAVAVRERQRRGGGPDLPGPPPGLSAGPCGPAGLGVIRNQALSPPPIPRPTGFPSNGSPGF